MTITYSGNTCLTSRKMSATLLSAAALASVLMSTAAYAQVPAAVEASQIDRRFKAAPEPLQSPDMGIPLPGQPKEPTAAQKAQMEKVKFTLKSVSVEGSTVFTADQLNDAWEGMIGQRISLLDAQGIASKITSMYQKAGYVLSQAVVPQQEVKDGTLKIRVVEGYINGIVIEGGDLREGERARIASYLENVKNSRPVRTQDLERYLLLANDLPGASVKGLLRPSTQFGAADLIVTVTNKRYDGALSLDNRGSKYIGPWQYSAMGGANSLLGMYDRTQVRFATATPVTELKSFEIVHEEMIGDEGTKLTLLASRTDTQPGDSLRPVQIEGQSDLLQAKVSHPFIRSRQENLVGRASFDWQKSDTDVFGGTDFTQDRLRVARVGGSYNFFDGWKGNNLFDGQVSQGLNILNASESGVARTNPNGESDFTKFNLDVTRLQPLPGNFSLFAAASGQYSLDPLLVAEQFSLGGASFGTAYDPAELLGDHGVAAKLELRYSQTTDIPYFNYYQLFTYYDIGQTWIRDGGPGSNDKRSLASVGAGIRTGLTDDLTGTVEVGVPLTKPASNQGDHGHDPRLFVGATARF